MSDCKRLLTENELNRFWSYVTKTYDTNSCWLWTGGKDRSGYGQFWLDRRLRVAHRVSFALHYGHYPIFEACHHCDVRHCVRHEHLFDGTQSANILDALAKGRRKRDYAPKGANNPGAKLSWEQVREIRQTFSTVLFKRGVRGPTTLGDIANKYEVSIVTVSDLLRGKTYVENI